MECVQQERDTIFMDGIELNKTSIFKYLGSILYQSGRCEKDVRVWITGKWRQMSGRHKYKKMPKKLKADSINKLCSHVWHMEVSVGHPVLEQTLHVGGNANVEVLVGNDTSRPLPERRQPGLYQATYEVWLRRCGVMPRLVVHIIICISIYKITYLHVYMCILTCVTCVYNLCTTDLILLRGYQHVCYEC